MLELIGEGFNYGNNDDDDDDYDVRLQTKLKDAVFSSIKLLEKEDPLAHMHDAGAICGGKYRDIHAEKMPHVLLTDAMEVELGAQEPWPQDIHLYQPHEVEQILLPDNANTLAVQAYLRMCGLKYQIEPRKNAEYMSPSGRVPFIKSGVFVLSDFENIVTFITNKGTNLTNDLTDLEKGDMRAYISLINNGLANAEQYICWLDPVTYNQVTKIRHGSVYPWPLNHIINWERQRQITKRLKVLGWANKTLEEIYAEVRMCCTALSERLDKKDYFYGDKGPKELDALVFGHLFTIITTPLPGDRLGQIVNEFPDLIGLCKRIEKRYFGKNEDE